MVFYDIRFRIVKLFYCAFLCIQVNTNAACPLLLFVQQCFLVLSCHIYLGVLSKTTINFLAPYVYVYVYVYLADKVLLPLLLDLDRRKKTYKRVTSKKRLASLGNEKHRLNC